MDTPDIDAHGRQLLRRASSPGVTHGGLVARRQAIGTGAALASEIQRRWTPADPAGWGNGPALHYAGQAPAGSPAPAAQAASAPRAQVVGQAASPAVQAAASMGASVQRQHLGTPVAAAPERTPRTPGTPGTARTDAAPMPVVQRQAAAPAAETVLGPAIVRRSAAGSASAPTPSMPLQRAADPLSREAGEGRGGGAPAAPSASVMMPAIVHRSAAGPAAASRPLTPDPSPIAHPSTGRGAPPPTPAAFPLSRLGGGEGRPQAGEGQGVRGSGAVQRSAAPAPAPSLSASAAELAMPLARSAAPVASTSAGGGVIQRQAAGGGEVETASLSPSEESGLGTPAPAAAGAGVAAPDIDEVVDQVMRRLTRTLAVESERHGGRRWP